MNHVFGIQMVTVFVSRFPRLYQPVVKLSNGGSMLRLVPFCNEQSSRTKFEMRFETNLLEMGQIPQLQMPRHLLINSGQTSIPFSYQRLVDHFPIKDSTENPKENFSKLGVTFDENAEKLAAIYYPGLTFLLFFEMGNNYSGDLNNEDLINRTI